MRYIALSAALLAFTASAVALTGIPQTAATVWIDDSGNGASTIRTWTDANQNYILDCNILNTAGNGECGPVWELIQPSPSVGWLPRESSETTRRRCTPRHRRMLPGLSISG
jgi:hypothetical protein